MLPDGFYQLRITATDHESGNSVVSSKAFQINHTEAQTSNSLMRSLYQAHPEANKIRNKEDAELVRNQIKYIAAGNELHTYDNLSIDGKNRFMDDFWEKRDPTPGDDINEFKVQHYARWDYANETYSSRSYQKGWATDRGRIFIMYGPPGESEVSSVAIDTRPYEIWRYYNIPGEGEAIFVFVDEQGHGDYRLFHSNVQGERYVREWEEKLQASKTIR
jgi:GWxTD domain-containing protein